MEIRSYRGERVHRWRSSRHVRHISDGQRYF
eukprot:COSAG02_NODE_58771_length_276_cov_0.847458_1_plen_30_part_10